MRRSSHSLFVFAALLSLALPAASQGQVLQRPRRPFVGVFGGGPPPDPNRSRQELTLTVNLLGGYDDNLAVTGAEAGRPPDPNQDKAGYLGVADVFVRYWRGTTTRSFEVEGRGYLNTYSNTDVGAIHGGSIRMGGMTPWGRRSTVHVDQRFSFDPLYTLSGGFAPLREAVGSGDLPSVNTTAGIFVRDSWSSDSMASVDRTLGRRNMLTGSYSFATRQYTDVLGGSSWAHRASAAYTRTFDRSLSLRSTYSYGHTTVEEVLNANTFQRPIEENTIDVGPSYVHRVSRTRQMLLSASVGATHIDTVSSTTNLGFKYWAPYGSAQARLDLGRSWALWGDYRRGMTVLDGLTIETYMTDTALLNVGGLTGGRVELVLTGGVANGRAPAGSVSNSKFITYLVAMQGQWAISRYLATVVNYSYYDYKFTDTQDLPAGVQPALSRNSVRFGLRLWVPLVGRYTEHTAATPTR